ncbi:hypothetical protein O9992_21185 [Vibrio lentus]|nr:hypothetical protein [Vibrio lentus]
MLFIVIASLFSNIRLDYLVASKPASTRLMTWYNKRLSLPVCLYGEVIIRHWLSTTEKRLKQIRNMILGSVIH